LPKQNDPVLVLRFMKKTTLIICTFLVSCLSSVAQTPSVYCTYWNGTAEYLASISLTANTIETIGPIPGSTSFPVASANGYDSYRNRYYTISNQGLVAIDATSGIPVTTASQYAGTFKHLNYNPQTDLLFATRYNGTEEEYYQISPVTFEIVNQGILNFDIPVFVVGFYGSDLFANEVIFQNPNPVGGIKTMNMATGNITQTFTRPDYLSNVLLAAHDPQTDFYFATGLQNNRVQLVRINKVTAQIDTLGTIPGVTAVSIGGSAVDVANRKFIFVSNLGITSVDLLNPASTVVIPYPAGAMNVKGFQPNYFSAPISRIQGPAIRAQFKNVETWLKDGMELPNTAVSEFAPSESGNYSYRVRRPDGSVSTSSEVSFSVTGSVQNLPVSKPKLFYNEFDQALSVQLPNDESAEVKIYNSEGRCLVNGIIGQSAMDVRKLPSGVYQAIIQQKGQMERIRFIKN
jgi:hypothetical protein